MISRTDSLGLACFIAISRSASSGAMRRDWPRSVRARGTSASKPPAA
jgi:hypothetical protein